MGSTRRHFTEEYKSQAGGFVIDDHRSIAEVARNIGVHEMTLGKWVKKTRDENTDPAAALSVDERSELERLRAENAELHMQVESQKKWRRVREGKAVKFAAIADWADSGSYDVSFMCAELGVSRSGFYAWRGRAPSARAGADATLTELIVAACRRLRGNPGVRRMCAELVTLGHCLSQKRVWRLTKAAGLQGRHPKPFKRTTVHGNAPVPFTGTPRCQHRI